LHEYEIAALQIIKRERTVKFDALQKSLGLEKDKLMWALQNLKAAGLVELEKKDDVKYTLTKEGLSYVDEMPEEILARNASIRPVKMDDSINKIALSWAKKNGWIDIKDGNIVATAKWKTDSSKSYSPRATLKAIKDGGTAPQSEVDIVFRRGLVEVVTTVGPITIKITPKGSAIEPEKGGIGAITHDVIVSEGWKKEKIRPYDINAPSESMYPARLHPLHEMINSVRGAWLSMGFLEAVGPIVESSFWNFDALFSPQDHPTREMQDTFFLSNPKLLDIEDVELLARVKKMHKKGWKQSFSEQVSKQAVLRTHTTSVSARGMLKFANALKENYPLKLFSVGRVFRNETIDYKHLAEFYQTDGIIIGDNLSLANLIDTLKKFYLQLGMENVRFKPSYFPFTEPSLEIHYYDEKRGEEIEIGGGGIIRQEITKAIGTDKTVLAWGLAIDRLMMQKLKIDTVTGLYKNDVDWLRSRPNIKV
jgi:phenylalanyl-tRNA synthetase alpha chain